MSLERTDLERPGWIAFGTLLAILLAVVAYAFLGAVVFGLFLYYATRPFYARIKPRVGQPTVAALLSLLVLAVPLVALLAYAAAIALQELGSVAATTDLGPFQEVIAPYLDISTVVDEPTTLFANVGDPGVLIDPALSALDYLGLVGTGFLYLFISITLAFYLLRDGHRLAGYAALVDDRDGVLRTYATTVDRNLQTVYFGNILNAFLTGVIGALAFSLLNLFAPDAFAIPYPALLGILAGAGSLIPVVGMKIVYVPLLLYLAARAAMTGVGWGFVALSTGVSVVVVDFIPDLLLRPYVSGGDLHTGTVLFAYVLGPIIWGWYGLFLGPLVLVLGAHFARLILPELLANRELTPVAVDPEVLVDSAAAGADDTSLEQGSDAGDETDDDDGQTADELAEE